ncbi:MAG TPA: sigma 54-interacting transcriptional regulator [Polyangiales bacterium]
MAALASELRYRGAAVAVLGVYAISKLVAEAQEPTRRFPDVLTVLSDYFELSDAVAILSSGKPVRPAHARGDGAWIACFAREALARMRSHDLPWVVHNASDEPLFEPLCAFDTIELERSYVAVPLRERGGVCGVLAIERMHSPGDQAAFCFDDDVRLLALVANVLTAAERAERTTRAPSDSSEPSPPEVESRHNGLLGAHPRWLGCVERAKLAARGNAPVILRGESGVGKEGLAGLIHENSRRRDRPYVACNCAALSETLLESELFGHERGAFTGAAQRRRGRFELADGGTLFLDELGEISLSFQARLLRVLQLGEFERVGGTSTLKVDVRIIAATNRNLEDEVRMGRFRADLYYRVSVVPIHIPALRERGSDITLLAREFLRRFNLKNQTSFQLDTSAIDALQAHAFPGNVRELENAIHRAATLATTTVLGAPDFEWLHGKVPKPEPAHPALDSVELAHGPPLSRERLIAAMEQAGWVQAKAARLLGLSARQVGYALQRFDIDVRRF